MIKKKRTVITIESDQVLRIRRYGLSDRTRCTQCTEEIRMVMPDEAAALAGVDTRTLYSLIDSGEIHFIRSPDDQLLICPKSLLAAHD